ncbi:hypothetical protein MTR_3g116275 [Medicago truncatula]|uniref:Uncharacterized protein n=1 Tax=Medicago truncatula TaxID=3880 RepID=A0A072V4X1_MEDTR|nr:hypothetical protein MTR_3g116275 [Medicago truncatula]
MTPNKFEETPRTVSHFKGGSINYVWDHRNIMWNTNGRHKESDTVEAERRLAYFVASTFDHKNIREMKLPPLDNNGSVDHTKTKQTIVKETS